MADNDGNDVQFTLRTQIKIHIIVQIIAVMNQLQKNMQQQFLQLQQQIASMNFQQSFFVPQNSKNNQNFVHSNGFFENNKKWNAKNIGYFDFDYDEKNP